MKKNEEAALKLLRQSFDLGSIEGGYLLGHMQIENRRPKEGLDTFNRLSDMGYLPAMYAMGYQYIFGDPSIRNERKGEEAFKRAARRGHFGQNGACNLMLRRRIFTDF